MPTAPRVIGPDIALREWQPLEKEKEKERKGKEKGSQEEQLGRGLRSTYCDCTIIVPVSKLYRPHIIHP